MLLSKYVCGGFLLVSLAGGSVAAAQPRVAVSKDASPREKFAAERLRAAVAKLPGSENILLAVRGDALLAPYDKQVSALWPNAKEAFALKRVGGTIIVAGFDPSGVLYGTEELIDRIHASGALPRQLDFIDHPQLKIRGAVIGLQKTELTYDHAEYDYPYTPQDFPWFYDKASWTKYLDELVQQRTNALFLWNGHPFTSLLKLPKYPEAQELPNEQLEKNIELFRWITAECDKRGIWILQGFYNIHLSHPFARAHNIPFHLSAPSELSRDYTRYCISEFIREYPNVGIFMTLGEAMGPHYGPEWVTTAIIPGVLDGLAEQEKAVGHKVPQPPIVIRAHATDIDKVLPAANKLYTNIDSMWKWNGESFTWTNIRGSVRERFQMMVANSNDTVVNMHLMSNFEPFRWGNPEFVQQTTENFVRLGIGGVHVYPLRYWDWPHSADNTETLLQQTDRDWIWFASWARYAWNPQRDAKLEKVYWTEQFARRFTIPGNLDALGHSSLTVGAESADTFAAQAHTLSAVQREAGSHLLAAYEAAGLCAPEVVRRLGITEGNRQVLSLGMTMPQLIDAPRFNPATTLWTGDAPDGEELNEWIAAEMTAGKHHGENPLGVAADAAEKSATAEREIETAAPGIAPGARPEYERVASDMHAIAALMAFYNHKVQAAALVMRYGYDRNPLHLTEARALLAASVEDFARLTAITDKTYRNAAGMQTSQRKIPVTGGPKTNHWRDLLPVYQKELAVYDSRLRSLSASGSAPTVKGEKLPQVGFKLEGGGGQTFTVGKGASLFADAETPMQAVSPEVDGLTGIRVSTKQATPIRFTLAKPALILVGFIKDSKRTTNVSFDAEQWNILLPAAVTPPRGLPISVWAKPLPAGANDLDLGNGAYVVLGFVPEETKVTPHVSFDAGSKQPPNLDWMFED